LINQLIIYQKIGFKTLVDNGKIPHSLEDNVMILRYEDVLKYKQNSMKKSLQAMEELARIVQENNLG
jgi:hypothetical protein